MNLITISGSVVMIIMVFMLVREAFKKPEVRRKKYRNREEIKEKFQQLNQMAAHIKV